MVCFRFFNLSFFFHDLFLQGSAANKFYVHNDIFRYEDEVFEDSEAEIDEGELITTNQHLADLCTKGNSHLDVLF